MKRRDLQGRSILITGASSGIGRALAMELAPRATKLYLMARSEQPLQELASELLANGAASAVPVAGDVTDSSVRAKVCEVVLNSNGGLDLLINNAGISAHGRFAQSTTATMDKIMQVNFNAVVELTRELLPLLSQSEDAVIVNIGSILGHRGVPRQSEYVASKFALRGWSEAVRPELAQEGIDLLQVSPGTVETDFFEHLIAKSEMPWGKQRGIPAEKVAQQIVHALERRKREIYPNWRGRVLVLLNRFFPALIDRVMRRYG